MEAWNEFDREAIDAGVLIANEALELPKTAKTLRIVEGGEPRSPTGPSRRRRSSSAASA